jgi:hypothetical protein
MLKAILSNDFALFHYFISLRRRLFANLIRKDNILQETNIYLKINDLILVELAILQTNNNGVAIFYFSLIKDSFTCKKRRYNIHQ